tara:strand:- start:374 stop:682 length:309 start_codon:yes stop_codon:yes gene_type:complete
MKKNKNNYSIYEHLSCNILGELVFDIGAAVGNVSRTLADMGAKVIAIEPQSDRFDIKKKHKSILVDNSCVSDEDGEIVFYQCKNIPNISTCFSEWRDGYYRG